MGSREEALAVPLVAVGLCQFLFGQRAALDVLSHGASGLLIGPIGPLATVDHARTFPPGAHHPKVRCPRDLGVAALS
jgi:hypothetical protein